MKNLQILVVLLLATITAQGQEKFLTKNGTASFFSSAVAEDIKADNKQVLSIIDAAKGSIAIAVLMKSFMFDKSLMQEHFNENYVESDTYPKATFKGTIKDFNHLNTNTKTTVDATIVGDISIHGVVKTIEINAKIIRTDERITLTGSFPIKLADFDIKIPSVVIQNIAETVDVQFDLDHKPYSN